MGPIAVLFVVLGVVTAVFIAFWIRWLRRQEAGRASSREPRSARRTRMQVGIGFVTDFLDTLGIGSFATTTALFRFLKQVPDRLIPGTLNVGHTLPTVLQAYIYIEHHQGRPADADPDDRRVRRRGVARSAESSSGFSRRNVQIGMGGALLVAAIIICDPPAHDGRAARGRAPWSSPGMLLAVGIAGNFVLGALMTIGVGLYAPCMILVRAARDAGHGGVPDHDGLLRVPDARRERALHREAELLAPRRARPHARRTSRPSRSPPGS